MAALLRRLNNQRSPPLGVILRSPSSASIFQRFTNTGRRVSAPPSPLTLRPTLPPPSSTATSPPLSSTATSPPLYSTATSPPSYSMAAAPPPPPSEEEDDSGGDASANWESEDSITELLKILTDIAKSDEVKAFLSSIVKTVKNVGSNVYTKFQKWWWGKRKTDDISILLKELEKLTIERDIAKMRKEIKTINDGEVPELVSQRDELLLKSEITKLEVEIAKMAKEKEKLD